MKPNLHLLTVCLIFLTFYCGAQQSDSVQNETILKIENPYKKGKTKWLNKNGFNTLSYDWSDQKINFHIEEALQYRATDHLFTGIGISSFTLGLVYNALGALSHALSEEPDKGEYKIAIAPYVISGVAIGTSLIFKGKAKKGMQKANKLYDLKNPK